jgi:hypothetical protein
MATKAEVLEERMNNLIETNSKEHEQILVKVNDVCRKMDIYAQKYADREVADALTKDVESLKSWRWWLTGAMAVILALIAYFAQELKGILR